MNFAGKNVWVASVSITKGRAACVGIFGPWYFDIQGLYSKGD